MKKKTTENKNEQKNQSGITLIALVVTIVVLLILAGVSISLVLGDNGIINKAKEAGLKTAHASVLDAILLEQTDYTLEKSTETVNYGLIEFFQSKNIVGNEVSADSGEYQINVAKLGLDITYGKGNATSGSKKDVYMLEGDETLTSYDIVYYGSKSGEREVLGTVKDNGIKTVSDLEKLQEYFIGQTKDTFYNYEAGTFANREPIMDASTSITDMGGYRIVKYNDQYYKLTGAGFNGYIGSSNAIISVEEVNLHATYLGEGEDLIITTADGKTYTNYYTATIDGRDVYLVYIDDDDYEYAYDATTGEFVRGKWVN